MKDAGRQVLFFVYEAPIAWNTGVALLSALLKEKGVETSLFVGADNLDYWRHVLAITPRGTLICFSHVILKDFNFSRPYIDEALMNGFEVAFGGTYHKRNNPNSYDGGVHICRGEGETLVDYVLTGDSTLFYEQKVFRGDLNSLPLPDYDLFKDYPYDGHIIDFPEMSRLPYNASRGCIGKCKFCEVRHQYNIPRVRTRMAEDLAFLKSKYEFELLFITDELAPYYDSAWRDSWKDTYHKFFAFIRGDIPEDTLWWMIDRGMIGCAFGVESGDEEFRNKAMGKYLTDKEIYRTASILQENNVYFAHFYMDSYPGETFVQKLATRKMSESLGGHPLIFTYANVPYGKRC